MKAMYEKKIHFERLKIYFNQTKRSRFIIGGSHNPITGVKLLPLRDSMSEILRGSGLLVLSWFTRLTKITYVRVKAIERDMINDFLRRYREFSINRKLPWNSALYFFLEIAYFSGNIIAKKKMNKISSMLLFYKSEC